MGCMDNYTVNYSLEGNNQGPEMKEVVSGKGMIDGKPQILILERALKTYPNNNQMLF